MIVCGLAAIHTMGSLKASLSPDPRVLIALMSELLSVSYISSLFVQEFSRKSFPSFKKRKGTLPSNLRVRPEEDEVIEDDGESTGSSSSFIPPDPLVHGPVIARPVGPTTIKVGGMNFGQLSLPKAPWINSRRTTRYFLSVCVHVLSCYWSTYCMVRVFVFIKLHYFLYNQNLLYNDLLSPCVHVQLELQCIPYVYHNLLLLSCIYIESCSHNLLYNPLA